jgi:osmotically-inducible protein OsmY
MLMTKYTKIIFSLFLLLGFLQTACAPLIITAPTISSDRRGVEGQFIDQRIELAANVEVQEIVGDFRVDLVSFNKKVLVVGQAPSQKLIEKIIQTIKNIENVEQVFNRMTVGKELSYKAVLNDAVITTNVITRIFAKEKEGLLSALLVKVYTENRVVYLMGLLSQQEAEQAINIAQNSKGAKKVVSLIEIKSFKK